MAEKPYPPQQQPIADPTTGRVTVPWQRFFLRLVPDADVAGHIPDGSIDLDQLEDIAAPRLLGRGTPGAGPIEEITVGPGLDLTGTELTAPPTAPLAHHATHEPGGTDALQLTAASRLFGRGGASGAGPLQEITLGVGLELTATELNAPGGGPSSTVFFYRADLTSTAASDPGTGKIRWNHATQALATQLYVDWLTTDGFNAVLFFELIGPTHRFILQDKDLALNYQVWEMTAPAINMPDWFIAPVTLISSSGAGVFSHNQRIAVLLATELELHHTTHEPGGTDPMAVDAAAAVGSLRTLGPGALQAAPGNDARFTAAPVAHHASHETSGSDALTTLSAAILLSGTLPDGRLSSNVPLKNAANQFTLEQRISNAGGGLDALLWEDVAQSLDNKKWETLNVSSNFYLRALNDAENVQQVLFTFARDSSFTLNGTLRAFGGQIQFPATQIPSADINTLDDYEEGTWTPIDGSGAGLALTSVVGRYTKIGNIVHFALQVVYPATASGAVAKIGGLPYVNSSGQTIYGAYPTFTNIPGSVIGIVFSGATDVSLYPPTGGAYVNSLLSGGVLVMAGQYAVS